MTGEDALVRALAELSERDLDSHTLRHEALARLRRVVPVDAYCFSELDPESQTMIAHATDGLDRQLSPRLYVNEYAERDFAKQRALIDGPVRACSLSQATRGDLDRSIRFQQLLSPMGVGHELRAACVVDGQAWGFMNLYRARGRTEFTADEIGVVARVGPLLGKLLRSSILEMGIRTTPAAFAPAVVVLDAANGITDTSGDASTRLEALRDPEEAGNAATPDVLTTLAIRARALMPDLEPAPVASARVRGTPGNWMTLHASRVTAADGGSDRVAVVISPAAAPDIRSLVFARLGLTPGERQVTELVLEGRSTKDIAGELFLSPYTVQDRLKAIFEKSGVRSRRELVARLH